MLLRYIGEAEITSVEDGYGNSLTLNENDMFFVRPDVDLQEKYPSLFEMVSNLSETISDDLQAIADEDLPDLVSDEVETQIDPLIQKAVVTLTTAQILALNTTPITLVAAPGADKIVDILSATFSLDYVAAAYATNTTIEVRYTNGSGAKCTGDVTALLAATADKHVTVKGLATEVVNVENGAVVAYAPNGNPATGDSDVDVTIFYRIVDVA